MLWSIDNRILMTMMLKSGLSDHQILVEGNWEGKGRRLPQEKYDGEIEKRQKPQT